MRNVGSTDRLVRLIAGIVLVLIGAAAFVGSPMLAIGPLGNGLVLLVGIVLVATAVVRFCPAYTLFGWNTDRRG